MNAWLLSCLDLYTCIKETINIKLSFKFSLDVDYRTFVLAVKLV